MNTIQETKGRLRLLAAALLSIRDNYGITEAQLVNFNTGLAELDDIIASMAEQAPAAPVTVADVIAAITGHIGDIEDKIDGLVRLANSAGTAPAPAAA